MIASCMMNTSESLSLLQETSPLEFSDPRCIKYRLGSEEKTARS